MHARIAVLACGACLVAGGLVGLLLGRARERNEVPASVTSAAASRDEPPRPSSVSAAEWDRRATDEREAADRAPTSRSHALRQSSTRPTSADEPGAPPGTQPHDGGAADEPASEDLQDPEYELEQLRQQLEALREELREVMGSPIAPPANLEPRFSGAVMSGSVTGAIEQANVPGSVEATDCSEHPCIVFGRLEGDEEDMEEVERTAALSTYDGDVLTLLFWATSVEEPGAKPAETGLFALAFYSFEDRASRGEELDRRIRARTMEYWNEDRPGRTTQ